MLGVQFLRRAGGLVPVSENNPLPVTAGLTAAGAAGSLAVNARAYRYSGLITRPADTTAYTAGDAIGDTSGSAIITMPNMGPTGGFVQIQSLRLLIYTASLPSGLTSLRLHFYRSAPTAIADNAAWDLVAGDRSAYLDFIELPTPTDMGSTLFSKVDWPGALYQLADGSTSLFGVLQTVGAPTFGENSTVLGLRVNAFEAGR